MSLAQVTALVDGKRVAGPKRDILEVQNAITAYREAPGWKPTSERNLLQAHKLLMTGLLPEAGRFRKGGVGIFHGRKVVHVAPPAKRVPELVRQLLVFYRKSDVHPVIRSSVLHYELTFIHPFSDGNGRLARLWQHVALSSSELVFSWVPLESVIRAQQKQYYRVLRKSDKAANSTVFIEFVASALLEALQDVLASVRPERSSPRSRLDRARAELRGDWFSRKDYMELHRSISSATASRDLLLGVKESILDKKGDRIKSRYRFR